jgi:hypothetical protein
MPIVVFHVKLSLLFVIFKLKEIGYAIYLYRRCSALADSFVSQVDHERSLVPGLISQSGLTIPVNRYV